MFCERQNIALSGHNDGGLVESIDDEICNDGNFRDLLRFRVDTGDQNFKKSFNDLLLKCYVY